VYKFYINIRHLSVDIKSFYQFRTCFKLLRSYLITVGLKHRALPLFGQAYIPNFREYMEQSTSWKENTTLSYSRNSRLYWIRWFISVFKKGPPMIRVLRQINQNHILKIYTPKNPFSKYTTSGLQSDHFRVSNQNFSSSSGALLVLPISFIRFITYS
jgi:hypothetical protein